MLSKHPVAFKFTLPLTLIASPLLLSAARPVDLELHQFPCNVPANRKALSTHYLESPNRYSWETDSDVAADDISELSGMGGPSLLGTRWATALRLLLSNRYTQESHSANSITNTPATAPTENNCLAQGKKTSESLIAQARLNPNEPTIVAQDDLLPDLSEPPARPVPTRPIPTSPTPNRSNSPAPAPTVRPLPRPTPSVEQPANPTPTRTPIRTLPAPPPARPANDSTPAGFPLGQPSSVDPTNVTPTNVNPTPFDGSPIQTLASRPDGNYRYVAGAAESRAYTDADLQSRGNAVFILRKEGNRVTGNLLPQIGQLGICVTGVVSGDRISGTAYPQSATAAETYSNEALQVQRPVGEGSAEGLYYASAVLDLSDFSMINAGSSLPPERCQPAMADTEDSN